MEASEVQERLRGAAIVPVVAIEHVQDALPLADALLAGGIPLIEITFRTAAAANVINILRRERPNLLVGAGTVLTQANAEAASQAGAQFAVAPGLNPKIVQLAQKLRLPFCPGIATPSDIESALSLGCQTLKFFPAELLGGVEMLNAFFGPYGHTGVKFIPTGGINPGNLENYIDCEAVAAVGGTWLAKKDDLTGGKWEDIRKRCVAALDTVRRVRCRNT
jgi:2-dehydro-3-deoxyphosphogluconate aldolase/(4S)-4-hydroxy-2-oxoglutarate aldolase